MLDFNKIELSILNKTESEIKNILSKYDIKNIHIDIMDGYFIKNLSNISPFFLKNLNLGKYKLHLHFMVEDVEIYFKYYQFLENIESVSFHIESNFFKNHNIEKFINKLKEKNIKVGLAINPETDLKILSTDGFSPLKNYDFIQLMSVNPGMGGQIFLEKTDNRVNKLITNFDIKIKLDGGINQEIYKKYENKIYSFVIGNYLYK